MYFGKLKVVEIDDKNIATFEDGSTLEVNKELLTEEPITGSELQDAMVQPAIDEVLDFLGLKDIQTEKVMDILIKHNVRLADIQRIVNAIDAQVGQMVMSVSQSIAMNQQQKLNSIVGNSKLETLSKAFGSEETTVETKNRMITINDILFN